MVSSVILDEVQGLETSWYEYFTQSFYHKSIVPLLALTVVLAWFARPSTSEALPVGFRSFQIRYLVGWCLCVAADWLQGPYVYALYSAYGYSKHENARLFVAGFGASLVFGCFVGSLADQFGRKKSALAYCLCYILSCATKHVNIYWVLMIGRILGGIATRGRRRRRRGREEDNRTWEARPKRQFMERIRNAPNEAEKFKARMEMWTDEKIPTYEELRSTELFAPIDDLQQLRIVYTCLRQCFDVWQMQGDGILAGFFAVHKEAKLQELKKDWAAWPPTSLQQIWPGSQWDQEIRNYFGEQVAFFFAWLSMFTRRLILPAIIAVIFGFRHYVFETNTNHILECIYSLGMVAWCALFMSAWKSESQTKSMLWGMTSFKARARELPDFQVESRGSAKEVCVRAFHWILASLFILETVYVAYSMSKYRSHVYERNKDEDSVFLVGSIPVSESLMISVADYAVTINIKVVSLAWYIISPRITSLENHRTFQQKKDAQIFKNFLVMCIVYYYPFFYLAFLKPHIENKSSKECLHEIEVQLELFFAIHIGYVLVMMALSLIMKRWSQYSEQKAMEKRHGKEVTFSYVEDLNKREPYLGDEDDYLELMISLGFITMFSVVLPAIVIIAFVSCLLELRIQAWRLVSVRQRPVPLGQEGIGAWEQLVPYLCNLSAAVSVALVIFTMEPLRSALEPKDKLIAFILAEHAMMLFIKFVGAIFPPESQKDLMILEQHADIYDRLMMNQKSRKVNKGKLVEMQDRDRLFTPGTVPKPGASRRVTPA